MNGLPSLSTLECDLGMGFVDESGRLRSSILKHPYYKLLCLLQGKGDKVIDLWYPFVFFKSQKQMRELYLISKMAEGKNVRFISPKVDTPEQLLYLYLDPKYEINARTLAFITENPPPVRNFEDRFAWTYLTTQLYGKSDAATEGLMKNLYLREGMPAVYVQNYEKSHSPVDLWDDINQREEFVQKRDGFEDFIVKARKAGKKAAEMLKEIQSSAAFKAYHPPVQSYQMPAQLKDLVKQ